DGEGRPTTDPGKALEGAVLPLGGAKGYALALLVETFAGIISGSAFGHHVGWIYDDSLEPTNVGHFVIALNVEKFMPFEEYLNRVEQMKAEIRSVPLADGCNRILLPGERKQEKANRRIEEGIPVKAGLLEELNQLAAALGVEQLGV
ncbi:MAG: Ldh family oxidoreductase, partial [Desulfotomaculaceae bacterium]